MKTTYLRPTDPDKGTPKLNETQQTNRQTNTSTPQQSNGVSFGEMSNFEEALPRR